MPGSPGVAAGGTSAPTSLPSRLNFTVSESKYKDSRNFTRACGQCNLTVVDSSLPPYPGGRCRTSEHRSRRVLVAGPPRSLPALLSIPTL